MLLSLPHTGINYLITTLISPAQTLRRGFGHTQLVAECYLDATTLSCMCTPFWREFASLE